MAHIQQLPATLSNQIAAGEVIERPASVIKELVENALDAQASQIDILVKDAGISLIKVADNGTGIKSSEVELAFLPHTTSKISNLHDLFHVHTLGFRGEALASIAAVAKVALTTSTDNNAGVCLKINGGQKQSLTTLAKARGTTVTVTDLFYNTPARLKYIKTVNTELNHIINIVNRLALAHPEVAFTLATNQRNLIRTSGNGNLQQTIAGIYGRLTAQQMIPFQQANADFRIQGYTSLPQQTRSNRRYISLIINGRYVVNNELIQAVIAGYESKLMVGRYPITVINIALDPLLVDVNVHPTKREVRLSKEAALAELIHTTIAQSLAKLNLIPDALRNLPQKTQQRVLQTDIKKSSDTKKKPLVAPKSAPQQIAEAKTNVASTQDSWIAAGALHSTPIFEDPSHLKQWDHEMTTLAAEPLADDLSQAATMMSLQKSFPQLQFMTQLHETYLVAQSDDGFYLVDQHAAQERVNYEKYFQQLGSVSPDQQNLLVPLVLDYANADAILIGEHLPLLQTMGVGITAFGQNSFVVNSYPTWIPDNQVETTIREMIDYVLKDGKIDIAKFREQTAITMSCKLSIKANHPLDRLQAQAVLDQLAQAKNPYNCPHGRPTLVHFSDQDIQKMFKRIQDPHQSLRQK